MDYLEIEGGNPLKGEVEIQGSKNAALPILAASVLHGGITVLRNCPEIIDVKYMLEILRGFGCRISREGKELVIDASHMEHGRVPERYACRMRSSVMLLGSLLGRMGEAFVPYPGGCVIGKRPVDIHMEALRKMGAFLTEEEQGLSASGSRLSGTELTLPFPSVGATENVIMAAVRAEGTTVLHNAAREPEIGELCRFLKSMGAKIEGMGTPRLCITGVEQLHDTEFTVMPDRIVAGTYLLLTAAAGGRTLLRNVPSGQLERVFSVLSRMGVVCREKNDCLLAESSGRLRGIGFLKTEPYPGFPTDLQSPLLAALVLSEGESVVEETIFEERFKIAEDLKSMGAKIRIEGRRAGICGAERLHGARLTARELRGGAALVLAATAAEGRSRIDGYSYIARGYENIIRDLQALQVMIHLKQDLE